MQNNKHLKFKAEGSPFNLEFPGADTTPKTNITPLTEALFKQKLNKTDFMARLLKERSFRVYFKKSVIGTAEESYCVLMRTKKGIPAQFSLLLVDGNQKTVPYTSEGPQGYIVYVSTDFNQFWDYLVTTVAELPENYATSCTLVDTRIPQT